MKQKITKRLLTLLCCVFSISVFAQTETDTTFISRMNYIFGSLEKNRVPYGLLQDYAFDFTDLGNYNGVLTDSNEVSAGTLRDIYSTLFTSAIHTNAGGFYSPDYVDSLWQSQRQPGIITLSSVYYNYARFRDDALSNNLITVSNDVIYDKYVNGVWQNPYQTQAVFAMSPPLYHYSGKSFSVVLPSNLWFTNNSSGVSSIAVNFDDGAGYRTLTMGQAVNISYTDTGWKTWTFKLTLTNNSTLYSHTEMKIEPEPNSYGGGCQGCRYPTTGPVVTALTATDAYLGEYAQGWISVDYANSDLKFHKPLIVAEGFDPGYLLEPELEFGETNFTSFIGQLNGSSSLKDLLQSSNQQYDIIYVDWKKGADYLQRNAYLLERVIQWVDSVKAVDNCTEPNVVLGQSMGGVISRWALRDMEDRSLTHDTRLFISWDAPQQGANVPLAYQHAARHANSLLIKSAVPTLLGGLSVIGIAKKALNLMDEPAAKEMLYNRVLDNGSLSNSDHTTWQTELKNKGYPQLCRNIAVSNGSECAYNQSFQAGATLLSYNGKGNTRILSDLIGTLTGPGLGIWGGLSILTLKPQFLLGIIPGKSSLTFDFECKAQPENSSSQIYKGKITFSKKILWLVNVNTTITDRTRNADLSVLAIDGTPGGLYDVELNLQNSSFTNWAFKYNISASNIPDFDFIPTVSSLDIGSGNTTLTLNDFKARYSGANPPASPLNSPFDNFITAYNQVTMSNGQINNNENHIQISPRNGDFVAMELNGSTGTTCVALCDNLSISGDNTVCTTSNNYTIPNLPIGATVTWSATPSGIATINSTNSIQTTLTKNNNGFITLAATIANACGGGNIVINKQIGVGYTQILNIGYPSSTVAPDELIPMQIFIAPDNLVTGNQKLVISRMGGGYTNTLYTGGDGAIEFSFPTTGTYNIKVYTYNDCGWSTNYYPLVFFCTNDETFILSPNPANTSLAVKLSDETVQSENVKSKGTGIKEIQLTDKMGNVLKRYVYSGTDKQVTIDVSTLKADIYYIRVFNGKQWIGKSFMKQ